MAAKWTTPGVYKEEIPATLPIITPVETALPVFIGYTDRVGSEEGMLSSEVIQGLMVTQPVRIDSLQAFERHFGKGLDASSLAITIEDTYGIVGSKKSPQPDKQKVNVAIASPFKHTLYDHLQMFFANGGGACEIISIGDHLGDIQKDHFLAGLQIADLYSKATLLVMPQAPLISHIGDAAEVYATALSQAHQRKDRFVLMDCLGDDPDLFKSHMQRINPSHLRRGAAYHPYLVTRICFPFKAQNAEQWMVHVRKNTLLSKEGKAMQRSSESIPYIKLPIPIQKQIQQEVNKLRLVLPPSGAVAGLYMQVDQTRGVWKAPANYPVQEVAALTRRVGIDEQRDLNVDTVTGLSINAIRSFAHVGILLWGARTLAGNDNEWRYISVSRFFMMVEVSCKQALEHFSQAPNEQKTWNEIKAMITVFLTGLWKQGAMVGHKPEEAFYVQVGLGSTMTEADIAAGRCKVVLGMAMVKPQEFVQIHLDLDVSR
jgi:phage tail sheath protein FI